MILTPSAISCHELRISPVQLLRGLKCEYSTGLGSWCLFDCIVWIWGFNDFLYRLVINPSFQPHSHSLLVPGPSWGLYGASQVVLVVKKLPTNAETQEMQVQSLGREDPLEEGMATHSSILAWRIPWTEQPGGLQSTGSPRVRHDWSDLARTHTHRDGAQQWVNKSYRRKSLLNSCPPFQQAFGYLLNRYKSLCTQ